MILKKILAYSPSKIIPALLIFAGLPIYTRFLTPEEFGLYTLSLVTAEFIFSILFHWLTSSFFRFYYEECQNGREIELKATAITITFVNIIIVTIIYCIIIYFLPVYPKLKEALYYGIPLIMGKVLMLFQQSKHRAVSDIKRYTLMDILQAVFGFGISLFLIMKFHLAEKGLLLGTSAGLFIAILYDISFYKDFKISAFSKEIFKNLAKYGIPIGLGIAANVIVIKADRFMLEYFISPDAVGVYSAGYTLASGSLGMIFMLIGLPLHPIIYEANSIDGIDEAIKKLVNVGLILLFITLPATVGIILTRVELVNLLLGEEFREIGIEIIPLLCIGFFLMSMKTHFFDTIFHLIKKTNLMAMTMIPASIINVILNAILIPKYGINGALYATVVSFSFAIVTGYVLSHTYKPITFPVIDIIKIIIATCVMTIVLRNIHFSVDIKGLLLEIMLGAFSYVVVSFAINTLEIRTNIVKMIARKL